MADADQRRRTWWSRFIGADSEAARAEAAEAFRAQQDEIARLREDLGRARRAAQVFGRVGARALALCAGERAALPLRLAWRDELPALAQALGEARSPEDVARWLEDHLRSAGLCTSVALVEGGARIALCDGVGRDAPEARWAAAIVAAALGAAMEGQPRVTIVYDGDQSVTS